MAEKQKTGVLQEITTNSKEPMDGKIIKKSVAYIFNEDLIELCSSLPKVEKRAMKVHNLIAAYGLLKKMRLIAPRPAREEELTSFHSSDYLECLKRLSNEDDDEKHGEEAECYGLTYDCPAYPGVYEYAEYVAGASVKAAQALMMGIADVAINWCGGWHHAKRDSASGFCYINDIVVAIMKLRQKYERVLYVDIDLHHGDGVEDAFCATSKVMTVSFHKASPGFFPGTGYITDVGMSRGRYYTVNVPLKDGIQDEQYVYIFRRVMEEVKRVHEPDVVVCQCGADGLSEDPMATYNLTLGAMKQCVKHLLHWNKPLLLLGGGGYNIPNTAKCWTSLTATVLDEELPNEIPEHRHFTDYGPDYSLDVTEGTKRNKNDKAYLDEVFSTIKENLQHISDTS